MTQPPLRDLLKASIPIFLGIFIILIYVLFIKEFIYCDWENCDPIEQSLVNALPVEDVDKLAIVSGDSPEIVQEKNRKLYEYHSLKLSGRILWTSLEATYFVSSVISYFVAFYIIYNSNIKNKKRNFVLSATLLVTTAIGIVLFLRPEILMRIVIALAGLTIDHDAPSFQKIFRFVNAIGFSALVALAIAEVQILLPNYAQSDKDFFDDVKRKTSYLNSILLVGTILLVNAILVLQSVFRWATAFLVQDTSMLSFSAQLTQNLITLWSIEFTAILAAVYLPGYFLLQSYALSRPQENTTELKKNQLKEIGLMLSPIEILSRILAITAPLIANPLFDVVLKALV